MLNKTNSYNVFKKYLCVYLNAGVSSLYDIISKFPAFRASLLFGAAGETILGKQTNFFPPRLQLQKLQFAEV